LLRTLLARRAGLPFEIVEADTPLSQFALDSLLAAEVAGEAEETLNRSFNTLDFISDHTIRELISQTSSAPLPEEPQVDAIRDVEMSLGQQSLLAATALGAAGQGLNIAQAFRIEGNADSERIRTALALVCERHTALRSVCRYSGNQVLQHYRPDLEFRFRQATVLTDSEAKHRISDLAWEAFDRNTDGALRAELLQVQNGGAYFVIVVDHLFADLTSVAILMADFNEAYQTGRLPNQTSAPYAEHLKALRETLGGPYGQQARLKWRERLALPVQAPVLPFQRPFAVPRTLLRPAGFVRQRMNGEEAIRFREVCKSFSVTPFTLLLAAFSGMMTRSGNKGRISIGVPMQGRPGNRFRRTVGYFVNVVPCILNLRPQATWPEVIEDTRLALFHAMEWQYLPLAEITAIARDLHGPEAPPLTEIMATLYREGTPGFEVASSIVDSSRYHNGTKLWKPQAISKHLTQFPLAAHLLDCAESIDILFEYDCEIFNESEVSATAALYCHYIRELITVPSGRLEDSRELPVEHSSLIMTINDTQRSYSEAALLHKLVENQVNRTPEQDAVLFKGERLSFRELNRRANLLAERLTRAGVGPDRIVAVMMERSLELVVTLLGILKAGGAYLPLESDYPQERLTRIINDARPVAIVLQPEMVELSLQHSASQIVLTDGWGTHLEGGEVNVLGAVSPDNLAYVIYTSGSTGVPKGVMNTHRGICNRLQWMQDQYGLTLDDRVLQKTPYTFDVSVWEFFWPLLTGATLVIASPGTHRDTGGLWRLIDEEGVTTVHFVPSMLQAFLDDPDSRCCTGLRRVICSGEALPTKLQRQFHDRLAAELHNLYGPTEAAVDVTAWMCRGGIALPTVPIGLPIANTRVHVLDHDRRECPLGVVGELYLGGVGLARGYLGQPGLSADRFVPDPTTNVGGVTGARLYRTGDLVRRHPPGYLEFVQRSDRQVKVRGNRIELGDVEFALSQLPGISQCIVTCDRGPHNDSELTAWVVPDSGEPLTETEAKILLRPKLPEWMIPTRIVELETLPLTTNGKVDRRALTNIIRDDRNHDNSGVLPETPAELFVANIWAEVLGCDSIRSTSNFYDLGGHSISALRVRARLHQTLKITVPLGQLLDSSTPHDTVTTLCVHLALENDPDYVLPILAELEVATDSTLEGGAIKSADHFFSLHSQLSTHAL
jgi:amino acid adenylation domain-containing protein